MSTRGDAALAEDRPVQRLERLGMAAVASGVLGVLAGIITVAYPRGVPITQWSYPFPVGVQWAVSLMLVLTHALTLAGFFGVLVADPHRGRRVASAGIWIAIVGYAGLSVCELLSGVIGGKANDSSVAQIVSTAFGVTSLLTAIGGVVAGVVIVRAKVWHGLGSWMVLASGIVMILVVTPAIISGDLWFRTVALTLWSLTFIPLGRTITMSARPPLRARDRAATG